jgi:hypothetical protein
MAVKREADRIFWTAVDVSGSFVAHLAQGLQHASIELLHQ